ncbi:hypothetical protein [Aurantiacibacter gangjinensis]|uniref:hypothetical protein n=1 Tax=Aurantiacibacter gangjinensis TaxID=502682 RepID=UPI00090353A0|nr:hypothetical protein [Aurantiacibacter gangjinensis]APE27017.1 hypothetical protein BMF35_a0188 [Aurantiacibacter gangjinensis]
MALSTAGLPAAVQAQVDVSLHAPEEPRPYLALMGTIPLYWGEAAGLDELLSGEAQPHWARALLERDFALAPLDYLSAETLANHDYLLMAQPRGLSGEENVALDEWVRAGGRLLLFADPVMTSHSRFHIGDRRRPQDTVVLSPILARWSLELRYVEDQREGFQVREFAGVDLPVNLPGELVALDAGETVCELAARGLVARCAVGEGAVTIIADAAILDVSGPRHDAARLVSGLVSYGLGISREFTVENRDTLPDSVQNQANTDESDDHGEHHHAH